ncbi:MAG: TetR/AcrR family transcriptional regulator [Thermodesulfobacteriota bacterium]
MPRKTLGRRTNLKEEQRRQAITRAAIKVFSAKGFDQATMDDIMLEAGCSKSLIYWYYSSKAALFEQLLDLCMGQHVELTERAVKSPAGFRARLSRLVGDFIEYYRQNPDLNKLVHFGSLHGSDSSRENFSQKLTGYHDLILKLLEEFFREGIASGEIKPETDVAAVALFLVAVVSGYVFLSIHRERMPADRAVFKLIEDLVFNRILT